MDSCIIEMENISCKVGRKYLLKDINWQIKEGDRWAVFGMNGSGKTTLLSIMAGFRHYTGGKLKIFGQEISNERILDIRRQIGWVSTSFFDKVYTKEAVMDIVLSGKFGTLGIADTLSSADRKRVKELLQELGLGYCAHYTFDMLSKGERQNVLIARALFSRPRILVLDEPCTGLDLYNREYLFKVLEQLAGAEKLTIIYVTHYVEEIKPIFDKCLLLKNGHVFASGNTKALFTDAKMSEFLNHRAVIKKDEQERMTIHLLGIEPKLVGFWHAD